MLQNQLCENININNEDFNILDATMVEKDPILAAYFNGRSGGKFCKHQKRQYSKPQHTTPESSTCGGIYSPF